MSRKVKEVVDKLQALVDERDHPSLNDQQYLVVDRPLPPDSAIDTLAVDHHGPPFCDRPHLYSATILAALLIALAKRTERPPALHPDQKSTNPDDLDEMFARMLVNMWQSDGCEKALRWLADNPRLVALLNLSEFFLLDQNFINLKSEKPSCPYQLSVYTSPRDVMYLWIDIGTSQIPQTQDSSLLDFRWQKQMLWIVENHVKNCPDSLITLVRTGMTQPGHISNRARKRSASSILTAGIWGRSDILNVNPSLKRTLDEFVLLTKTLRLQLL